MSQHQEEMMYAAQARIISKLNKQIEVQREYIQKMDDLAVAGQYYNAMQHCINEHTMLQGEWVAFIATMKLCVPDLKERFELKPLARFRGW